MNNEDPLFFVDVTEVGVNVETDDLFNAEMLPFL